MEVAGFACVCVCGGGGGVVVDFLFCFCHQVTREGRNILRQVTSKSLIHLS